MMKCTNYHYSKPRWQVGIDSRSTEQTKVFHTSTGLIPTSMTTAPGLIQLPLTMFGCPTAAITMSASRVISSGFFVLEWTTLTVASSLYQAQNSRLRLVLKEIWMEQNELLQSNSITCRRRAAGIPTMLLLPITTALFPLIGTLYLCNNSMHPLGVHGTNSGSLSLMARRPIFRGLNPSTSFSMQTAFKIACSFIC